MGVYLYKDGELKSIAGPQNAADVYYDNTGTISSANNVQDALTNLNTNLTANGTMFQFLYDGVSRKYGYKDANGNFIPFDKVQAGKTVTAGTSVKTVTPDGDYDGLASVTINPTPSQAKSITAATSAQTVNPDSGNLLSRVTVNPQPHTTTRATVTSNGTIDLGTNHAIRYVPVNVPTSPTGYAYSWMLRGTAAQKYSNCTQMTAVSGELEGIYIKANVTGKYWDNVSGSERTVNAGDTIVSTSVPNYGNFTFITAFYLG